MADAHDANVSVDDFELHTLKRGMMDNIEKNKKIIDLIKLIYTNNFGDKIEFSELK